MEICAAKSEEVAYYVRLARSYSSPAVAAPKTTVKTAWDCCPRGRRGPVADAALAKRTARASPPHSCCIVPSQLGRASCRDSMCPYVEIVVVAFSFKKKNST